ncbi:MAG: hypothetical protein VW840_07750 [Gammaproteobacteria bacterium]
MNNSLPAPEPMTDLARLLAGPQGAQNLDYLMRTLNDEEMRITRQMSAGLDADAYAQAGRRVLAVQHAQSVLKSLNLYLEP